MRRKRRGKSAASSCFTVLLLSGMFIAAPALAQVPGLASFEKGMSAMQQKDNQNALRFFSESIAVNPNFTEAYLKRGQCLVRLRNFDDAIKDFDKAIELKPGDYNAFLERGTTKARNGKHEDAVQDYLQAARLNPELAKQYQAGLLSAGGQDANLEKRVAQTNVGAVHDYEQAMHMFLSEAGSAISTITNHGPVEPKRGIEMEEITQSISRSTPAAVLPSSDVVANFEPFANPEQEIKNVNKALRLDPGNAELLFKRGHLNKQLKRFDNAISDYSQAISTDPMQAKYYLARARIYHEQNQPDLCNADIQQALSVDARLPRNFKFK